MSNFIPNFGAIALAGCLSLAIGSCGALAQGVPPGCVATGDPNAAAAGAVIGGLTGALVGNAVSGSHQKAQGTVLGGLGGALAGAVIGNNAGQGVSCPPGYIYRDGPPPQPAAVYDEPPPPTAQEGEFWYGAPPHIHDRIVFLRRRVEAMDRDGWLSPRDRDHLFHRLSDIEHREQDIRRHNDGHLPPEARERLANALNEVSGQLRWEEYSSEHPGHG
jgi:Glycine zipper 2TM domain